MDAPLLFLDTGSPVVSVALGAGGETATRTIALRRSSERLLSAIEAVLDELGAGRRELGGIAVLQGPGSFTGLRVGLATALGLHQALGVPATALPTLPVLAAAAGEGSVTAAVDALRGDWYAQRFEVPDDGPPRPLDEPGLRPASGLLAAGGRVIGFGVGALEVEGAETVERIEPPPLAPVALARWRRGTIDWDPARLTAPIYFRPPAVTLPGRA